MSTTGGRPAAPAAAGAQGAATAPRSTELLLLAQALLLLLLWDRSPLDLAITDRIAGPEGFAWRHQPLLVALMHDGARWLAWGVFVALLVGIVRPLPFARALSRARRLWWPAATLACLFVIVALKQLSDTSCPWSLADYGGDGGVYVPHWVLGLDDGGPGGCFPSGHAATGFALLPGWYVLRDRAPRAATAWLVAAVIAGLLFGAVQVLRGAHFASHVLWTGWFCWAASALAFRAGRWWQRRAAGASPGAGRTGGPAAADAAAA